MALSKGTGRTATARVTLRKAGFEPATMRWPLVALRKQNATFKC